tara:strand:+ start:689 stop:892 length:204 start_codon:yes stop_codon:yes gene_type:complete
MSIYDTKQALRTKNLIVQYTADIKVRKQKIAETEELIAKLKANIEYHDSKLSNLRHERMQLIANVGN